MTQVEINATLSRLEAREREMGLEIARGIATVDGVAEGMEFMAVAIDRFSKRQEGCQR